MIRITDATRARKGDVLLVSMELEDKQARTRGIVGAMRTWTWFGVVTRSPNLTKWNSHNSVVELMRLDMENHHDPRPLDLRRHEVKLLEESEWPQGVHVMMARAVMLGFIDPA